MSETQQDRRARVVKETAEDLNKTLESLLTDVHDESERVGDPRTIARFASLLCVLSIQADIQTRRIVRLTWGLFILTAALSILTAYLCYDAYEKAHSPQQQQNSTP